MLALLPAGYSAASPPPVFVRDGRLVIVDAAAPRTVTPRDRATRDGEACPPVDAYWGALADGRLVVTFRPQTSPDSAADPEPHCSTHSPGSRAALVNPDGTLDAELGTGVLRAFPSPAGSTVALVSTDRNLSLWRDGSQTTITAPGRISNAGWSPDGRFLAVSAYPPDWSEGAVSSARTTAEFLRLQNADLHLFDTTRMAFVGQLTSDPGTEYGPFFSPDGRSIFYVWLHATEDRGGLMRLDLDRDGGTSATAPATPLTRAGNDAGETPLGRVGTYVWRRSGTQLAFEAGRPDGSGEIWAMSADGRGAVRIAAGRKPQATGDAGVVFLDEKGVPQTVVPEVRR